MSETLVVEAVAKNGKGIMAADKAWHNISRNEEDLTFSTVKPGYKLAVERDSKGYIVSYEVEEATEKKKPEFKKSFGGRPENTPEKDAMIARHTAVKAVMESTWAHDTSDAVEERFEKAKANIVALTQYIVTGKF